MGDSTPRGPPIEPAIHEVSIEEGGVPRAIEAPAPAGRPWVVALVIAATVAGLGYGFMLGRGDRPAPSLPEVSPSTTPATISPATAAPSGGPFVEGLVPFIRRTPGDDLGPGVTEYLGANRFETLTVDADGTIWAGGTNGVVRLDPATGEFTRLTTGLRNVTAVAAAPDGSVWAASMDGLSRWVGSERSHDSHFPAYYPSDIWMSALEVGPEGDVWLATSSFAGWMVTGQLHRLEEPYVGDMWSVAVEAHIAAIELSEDGALWVLSGSQLWRFDGAWHEMQGATPASLDTMTIDTADRVWIGGEDRLAHWDGQEYTEVTWRQDRAPPSDTGPPELEFWVQALTAGIADDVWALVGTIDPPPGESTFELIQFESDTHTIHPMPDELANPFMRALAVAPDGAVWVTTETGFLRFDGEWNAFSMEEEPPFNWINTVAAGEADTLWIADQDGFRSLRGDDWRRYSLADLGLNPDQEGNTWVATGPDGSTFGGVGCRAFRLIEGTWIRLPEPTDDPNVCFDMTASVGPDGSLWLHPGCCFGRSATYRWSTGEWQQVPGVREFLDIAFTATGEMWLADDSGVKRAAGNGWEPVLAGIHVTEIAISGDGVVWAAEETDFDTTNVWRYDGATWILSQSATQIHSLAEGPDGTVWGLRTLSNGRTHLVDLETGDARYITGSPVIGDIAVMADGTVWIGADARLYRVDPLG